MFKLAFSPITGRWHVLDGMGNEVAVFGARSDAALYAQARNREPKVRYI